MRVVLLVHLWVKQSEEQSSVPLVLEPQPGEVSGAADGAKVVSMEGVEEEQEVTDLIGKVSEKDKIEEVVNQTSNQV